MVINCSEVYNYVRARVCVCDSVCDCVCVRAGECVRARVPVLSWKDVALLSCIHIVVQSHETHTSCVFFSFTFVLYITVIKH